MYLQIRGRGNPTGRAAAEASLLAAGRTGAPRMEEEVGAIDEANDMDVKWWRMERLCAADWLLLSSRRSGNQFV